MGGGARGRGRGASAGAGALRAEPARPRAAGQPQAVLFQSAVLFKIVPERETVVMEVDAVVALMGMVYCR